MQNPRSKLSWSWLRAIAPQLHPLQSYPWQTWILASLGVWVGTVLFAIPVAAHHPMGGDAPTNAFEGIMSGLAHPIVGVDHVAFIVATGLLAALKPQGFWIPIAFVLTSLAGTGIHLINVDLPALELLISLSVLGFGILLTLNKIPNLSLLIGLAAISGLFHGYAYGEAIIGAEMTPIVAYLLGFTTIQILVAIATYRIGQAFSSQVAAQIAPWVRSAGFVICGVGAAFLSSVILG
jgi:urease accessory protein